MVLNNTSIYPKNNEELKQEAIEKINKILHQNRSTVLEAYNFIDFQISTIISQYYFGEFNDNFVSRVLYASSMTSFGRIEIFRSILKETKMYNKRLFEQIQLLTKIRNNFAHGSYIFSIIKIITDITAGNKPDKITMFNPKKSSDIFGFDCITEYNRFMACNKKTQEEITNIYKKIVVLFPNKK
jgi:hypothetical protein